METAELTGIPLKSIMGPVNYRPLKQLGTHSGTSQASNEYSPNQGGNSRTVESGGEAA